MADVRTAMQEVDRRTVSAIRTGSMAEAVAGMVGLALAIIAWSGVLPVELMAIAGIVLGLSLLFEGSGVSDRLFRVMETASSRRLDLSGLSAGASVESLGGVAGIALGILALIGYYPQTLMAITAVVFGGSIVLGGGLTTTLNAHLIRISEESEEFKQLAGRAVAVTSDLELLIGVGVATLGVLALSGLNPFALTLAAFICIGASDLLKSLTVGGKVARMFSR